MKFIKRFSNYKKFENIIAEVFFWWILRKGKVSNVVETFQQENKVCRRQLRADCQIAR